MPKQIKLYAYAAVVTFAIVGPTHAQPFEPSYDIPMAAVIASAGQTTGTAGVRPGATPAMQGLLTQVAACSMVAVRHAPQCAALG